MIAPTMVALTMMALAMMPLTMAAHDDHGRDETKE
jgi:hypothetical protein